jgi:hypothetical protein
MLAALHALYRCCAARTGARACQEPVARPFLVVGRKPTAPS